MVETATICNFTEFNVRQEKGAAHFVRLHDSVVKDLERQMASGGEQSGILLGRIEAGDHCTIAIEEFEPAARLEKHIRAWTPGADRQRRIVGYYRSHSRSKFVLEATDRELFQRCFSEDPRLLLLIQPPSSDVSTAMFYLGENGHLAADRTTVEFPLNLRELGAEDSEPAAAPARLAAPAPSPSGSDKLPRRFSLWKPAAVGVALIVSVVGLRGWRVFETPVAQQPQPKQPMLEQPAPVEPPADPFVPAATAPEPTKPKPAIVMKRTAAVALVPGKAQPLEVAPAPSAIVRPPGRSQQAHPPVTPPAPEAQPRAVVAAPAPPKVDRQPPPPVNTAPKVAAAEPTVPLVAPRVIRQFAPAVRENLRRSITGELVIKVRVNVDATGKVISTETLPNGHPLAEAVAGSVAASVKRWEFEPARRGDEKVPGSVVLSFTFRK